MAWYDGSGMVATPPSAFNYGVSYALDLPQEDAGGPSGDLGHLLTHRDAEWLSMEPYWRKMAHVRGGTALMQGLCLGDVAGNSQSQYLPKMARETPAEWKARVRTSVLLDFVVRAVEAFSSKPFAEPTKVTLPSYLSYLMDDIDGMGTSFEQWSKTLFQEIFYNGLVHVIPIPDREGGGGERPRLKTIEAPYMFETIYDPDARGWEYVRFAETRKRSTKELQGVRKSYTETTIWSVSPTGAQRWGKTGDNGKRWERLGDEVMWSPSLEGRLPLSTAYSIQRANGLASSSFWSVVDLMIKHFRALSEHEFLLRQLRQPVALLWDSDIETGASAQAAQDNGIILLKSTDLASGQGKMDSFNVDPAAVAASHTDIETMIEEMANRTVSILLRHPTGQETATAAAIDSAEETSELSSAVTNIERMLEWALFLAARMVNPSVAPGEISVQFDRSFDYAEPPDLKKEVKEIMDDSREAASP